MDCYTTLSLTSFRSRIFFIVHVGSLADYSDMVRTIYVFIRGRIIFVASVTRFCCRRVRLGTRAHRHRWSCARPLQPTLSNPPGLRECLKKRIAKIRNWVYICYAVYAELESCASGSNPGRVHGVAERPDRRKRCSSTRVGSQKVSPTHKLHTSRAPASPVHLPSWWLVRSVLRL